MNQKAATNLNVQKISKENQSQKLRHLIVKVRRQLLLFCFALSIKFTLLQLGAQNTCVVCMVR